MKMVFYRCQAIHISCRLQIAKNIAIWPPLACMLLHWALLRAMYCSPNIVKHRQHVWYLVLSCSWSWFLTVVTTIRLQNIPRKPSVISRNTAVEALLEGEWQRQVGVGIHCVCGYQHNIHQSKDKYLVLLFLLDVGFLHPPY